MSKAGPVIRLYFARMKPAWHSLSDNEKAEFMRRDRENLDALGMQALSMIDCSQSDNEWDYIGVEQWPSAQAISQRELFEREQLDLSRYVESDTLTGLPMVYDSYGQT